MIAIIISLVLIATIEIVISSSEDGELSGIKAVLKQYGVLVLVVLLLITTLNYS